jgi:hypothetical protein
MDPAPELNYHVENTPVPDPVSGEVIIPDLYMTGECWLSGYGTHFAVNPLTWPRQSLF